MELRITQYGEPVLRKPALPVEVFDAALQELAAAMIEAMYAADGIGLAAPQIGQSIRLFVADLPTPDNETRFSWILDGRTPPLDLFMPLVVVNPKILSTSNDTTVFNEGCLSFPGIRGDIARPEQVEIQYQDLEGTTHTLSCTGLFARCIQHEYDHLEGTLFIDRMEPSHRKSLEARLKKLKRASQKFLKQRA